MEINAPVPEVPVNDNPYAGGVDPVEPEIMIQQHPLLLKPKKKETYSFALMYDLECHTIKSTAIQK